VRVLMVSAPMLGHVFPLVPLARAMVAAGHDVEVATAGDGLAVGRAGLPVHDLVPGFDFTRIVRRVMLSHPLVARAELAGTAGTRGVRLLFGPVNDQLADPLVDLVRRTAPDLIVYEPLAPAALVAAARAGVPAVLQENSLFDGPALVQATGARLAAVLGRHRLAALPASSAVVSIAPPSVLPGRTGWPMRPVPYGGEGALPDWLAAPAARPRIAVTRSTVAGPGAGRLMRTVPAAAGGVDAEFVLVRPDRDATRKPLPDNVRTVDWVPLSALLASCAAVVHHGGAGTALAALYAGVPQLIVNGPGDRRPNGQLIAARGAGLALDERGVDAAALTRLVTDAGLRESATAVRDEIAAMPPPADLVPRLEALVG
jgi:UDP:flavonoid glycosyltransferase YjiC (YdhE family)